MITVYGFENKFWTFPGGERSEAILVRLAAKGFASDNIVFGVGSYT
jgi:hypothetical protein